MNACRRAVAMTASSNFGECSPDSDTATSWRTIVNACISCVALVYGGSPSRSRANGSSTPGVSRKEDRDEETERHQTDYYLRRDNHSGRCRFERHVRQPRKVRRAVNAEQYVIDSRCLATPITDVPQVVEEERIDQKRQQQE